MITKAFEVAIPSDRLLAQIEVRELVPYNRIHVLTTASLIEKGYHFAECMQAYAANKFQLSSEVMTVPTEIIVWGVRNVPLHQTLGTMPATEKRTLYVVIGNNESDVPSQNTCGVQIAFFTKVDDKLVHKRRSYTPVLLRGSAEDDAYTFECIGKEIEIRNAPRVANAFHFIPNAPSRFSKLLVVSPQGIGATTLLSMLGMGLQASKTPCPPRIEHQLPKQFISNKAPWDLNVMYLFIVEKTVDFETLRKEIPIDTSGTNALVIYRSVGEFPAMEHYMVYVPYRPLLLDLVQPIAKSLVLALQTAEINLVPDRKSVV